MDIEIPGSLVSEPKHRDSRFKSRPGTGLGIEIQSVEDSESVSEPKLRHSKYRNRNRNQKSDIPGLGIGTGIEFLMIMESSKINEFLPAVKRHGHAEV